MHRPHVEVERRRGAPVQAQFLVAVVAALRNAAEVEERQAQRLAQLVGVIARQQQRRDVGLDQGAIRPERALQRRHQRAVLLERQVGGGLHPRKPTARRG